jgi:hypothetical protein
LGDKNEMHPLHHAAACSYNLSEKSLEVLVDYYTYNVTFNEKYDTLSFHYPCSNPAQAERERGKTLQKKKALKVARKNSLNIT